MFVYIIKCTDGPGGCPECLYVGQTNNLGRRMTEHFTSQSKYTSKFGHHRLLWSLEVEDRQMALLVERKLKQNRRWVKALVNESGFAHLRVNFEEWYQNEQKYHHKIVERHSSA